MSSSDTNSELPRRGIFWVLRAFFCGGVYTASVLVLLHFFILLVAEQKLLSVAQAASKEATLPRATSISVTQTVRKHLAGKSSPSVHVIQNGIPVIGSLRVSGGDTMAVLLSIPSYQVLPSWFEPWSPIFRPRELTAQASNVVASR